MGFPTGLVVKNLPAMQETQEMWVRSLGWEDPLEEEMTTHSSILAWRIPWRKEPDQVLLQPGGWPWVRPLTGASCVALVVKNLPGNAGDVRDAGSIPELERSPGGGPGNTLQYSCLENPMDRGAWRDTAYGVIKSQKSLK